MYHSPPSLPVPYLPCVQHLITLSAAMCHGAAMHSVLVKVMRLLNAKLKKAKAAEAEAAEVAAGGGAAVQAVDWREEMYAAIAAKRPSAGDPREVFAAVQRRRGGQQPQPQPQPQLDPKPKPKAQLAAAAAAAGSLADGEPPVTPNAVRLSIFKR
eukprot:COSAG01_NODE_4948_length_4597_cov_3.418853_2_plen_155_part_00